MAMIPKRGCDVMKCETARLLKLTSNSIEPLSFVVPRKVRFLGRRGCIELFVCMYMLVFEVKRFVV